MLLCVVVFLFVRVLCSVLGVSMCCLKHVACVVFVVDTFTVCLIMLCVCVLCVVFLFVFVYCCGCVLGVYSCVLLCVIDVFEM